MKTILMTVLLACALIAGACSRSDKQPITAVQATPTPKSEAELATSAESDRFRAVPSISRESEPAVAPVSGSAAENDPASGSVSALAPVSNSEKEKDPGTGPVSGIEVEVVSSTGKTVVAHAKTDVKGAISVRLPKPGNYVVRYTSGPSKGKVIRTINATEAGTVNISVPPPSAAP